MVSYCWNNLVYSMCWHCDWVTIYGISWKSCFLPILAVGLIRGLYFLLSYKNKRIYISEKEILYFSLFNKQYMEVRDNILKAMGQVEKDDSESNN